MPDAVSTKASAGPRGRSGSAGVRASDLRYSTGHTAQVVPK